MNADTFAPDETPRRDRALFAGVLLLTFMLTFAFLAGFKHTYIDDAFIQLTYARTLVEDGTWGMFPGRIANTATAPLNILLTAAAGLITRDWLNAVIWLTALEFTALLGFLLVLSQRLFGRSYFGAFAFIGLVANPLLLSTLGMESILFTLLIVAALTFYAGNRWLLMAASLGLLTLARHEGVLLLGILLLVAPRPLWQQRPRQWLQTRWQIILVYALVLLPWLLYSWIAIGSLFPDTLIIKTGQGSWGAGLSFHNGITLYLNAYPWATWTSFFLLPLGLFALWRTPPRVKMVTAVLAAYALLHYVAYWILRVPPYHWYYMHQVIVFVLLGALGAASLLQHVPLFRQVRALPAMLLLLPALGILGIVFRAGYPLAEAPIHSNWATQAEYAAVGEWLQANFDDTVAIQTPMEIGTVAFFSRRYMVNEFSDLNFITRTIENSGFIRAPVVGQVLRLNYLWRAALQPVYPRYVLTHKPIGTLNVAAEDIVMTWPAHTSWVPAGREYLIYLYELPPDYWQGEGNDG